MSNKRNSQGRKSGGNKRARGRGKSDAGICAAVLVAAERLYPSDPRAQAAYFMEHALLPAAIGRARLLGAKRTTEFGNIIQLCITQLQEMRRPIQNLSDLKRKPIVELVRRWVKASLSQGVIDDRISILRRFTTLIGKGDTLPRGRQWRHHLEQQGVVIGRRSGVARLMKGWMDMGIDPRPVIEAVRAEEEVCGSNMEMMWAFGCRLSESVQNQPSESDKGDYFLITRGTKGGKTRQAKFSSDPARRAWQREVLERAKKIAAKHPKGLLAIPGLTLAQMKDRLEYVAAKHGVSKAGLGVTLHGLRHQFGTDLFKELTGMSAPVLQLLPKEAYDAKRELVRAAYLEIARQMGHERWWISGAYLSTPEQLGRQQRQQLLEWQQALSVASDVFIQAGVSMAWIVGGQASGLHPRDAQALQVAVRMSDSGESISVIGDRLELLRIHLVEALNAEAAVFVWMGRTSPEEGVEVFSVGSGQC